MGSLQKILVRKERKKFEIEVKEVKGLMRGIGLMFKSKETNILLFNFSKPCRVAITSLMVFFPFLAVWTDSKGNISETRVIEPFTFSAAPKKSASKLIELPMSRKNMKLISKITRLGP